MITTAIMSHTKAFPAGEEKIARVSVTAWCARPVWAGSLPDSWAADLGERSVTVYAISVQGTRIPADVPVISRPKRRSGDLAHRNGNSLPPRARPQRFTR